MKHDNAWIFESEERRRAKADAEYAEQGNAKSRDWHPVSIEIEGVDTSDYPDFADAFICYAERSDTGEPLTDEELDELNQDSSFVYDCVIRNLY